MTPETPELRRRIMQAVRGVNTSPELLVRRLLHRKGYRYRLHRKDLPGKPDLVFPSRRKVIFVHGCFWHGHDCARGARTPKTNVSYWAGKIERNRQRDMQSQNLLHAQGWGSFVLWECELKDVVALSERLEGFLTSSIPLERPEPRHPSGADTSRCTRRGGRVKARGSDRGAARP